MEYYPPMQICKERAMNELAKFIYHSLIENKTGSQIQIPLEDQKALKDLHGLLSATPQEVAESLKEGLRPEPWPTFRLDDPGPVNLLPNVNS
jgi:hypothetical protein